MIIKTNRLILISPDMIEPKNLTDYVVRNKFFLEKFEPKRPEEYYSLNYQSKQLKQQEINWEKNKNYCLYISPKENDKIIIGHAALNGIIMDCFCSCYLGYQLDKDYINRGLMTEAVKQIVSFGFYKINLHRIECNIMPKNIGSIRVAEKCGFQNEGTSKKYMKINDIWEDHFHYVILNENIK